jgi:hypothetical protein
MPDRRYLLTPTIIACELAHVADAGDRHSELVVVLDPDADGFAAAWWCEGRALSFKYTGADLALSLDDFSERFLAPVVASWKLGQGHYCAQPSTAMEGALHVVKLEPRVLHA